MSTTMNITKGRIETAKKVVIYGPEGIGKSTFASQFPDPLFIDTEGSTKEMDVARFDKPTSWELLKSQIEYVKLNKPCATLIIDTIDWAEQLCIKSICDKYDKKGIEDFGYGNGYVYEKEEFGRFLNLLEEVIEAGVNVVLTAHAILRKFEQPDELGSYDRWELKLGKKTTNLISPLVKEWADMVLFANYKTISVAVDKDGKKHKAQGGRRIMYTSHHPCWDAKNRYGLPEEIPMEYGQIKHIIERNIATQPAVTVQTAPVAKVAAAENATTATNDNVMSAPAPAITQESSGIPKALADLMTANSITEEQIRAAVASKGYFPADMPIKDYPKEFIEGVLIGAWEQVKAMITEMLMTDYENEAYPF